MRTTAGCSPLHSRPTPPSSLISRLLISAIDSGRPSACAYAGLIVAVFTTSSGCSSAADSTPLHTPVTPLAHTDTQHTHTVPYTTQHTVPQPSDVTRGEEGRLCSGSCAGAGRADRCGGCCLHQEAGDGKGGKERRAGMAAELLPAGIHQHRVTRQRTRALRSTPGWTASAAPPSTVTGGAAAAVDLRTHDRASADKHSGHGQGQHCAFREEGA